MALFTAMEKFWWWLGSNITGNDGPALCNWTGTIDDETFITVNKGGDTPDSLVTYFEVMGSRRFMGEREFNEQAFAIADVISQLFKSSGKQHKIFVGCRISAKEGEEVVLDVLRPSYQTAKRIGADADFLFADRFKAMASNSYEKILVIGLQTNSSALSPNELTRWAQERLEMAATTKEALVSREQARLNKLHAKALAQQEQEQEEAEVTTKKKGGLAGLFGSSKKKKAVLAQEAPKAVIPNYGVDIKVAQSVRGPAPTVVARHQAALKTLEDGLTGQKAKLLLRRLRTKEVRNLARRFIDASAGRTNWGGRQWGDGLAASIIPKHERVDHTVDMGLPMAMGRQVITGAINEHFQGAEYTRYGQFYYAPVTVEICPMQSPNPSFSELEQKLRDIPWSMTMEIDSDANTMGAISNMILSIVGSAGQHNKSAKAGVKELSDLANSGVSTASLNMSFMTWSRSREELLERVAMLKSSVDNWGQTVSTNETGAPGLMHVNAFPGFARDNPAPMMGAPLVAITRMLPFYQPNSIWKNGHLIAFTQNGLPYPIHFNSTEQNYWGTLIFAPTGSGKSFALNMINAGILLHAGANQLPFITMIDKGPSAKGLVMLAKAILPPEKAEQVVYWRPTPNDTRFTVNPWDTELGCDKPLSPARDYLITLIEGMTPELGTEGSKFIGMVVDKTYEKYSRLSSSAKRWNLSYNAELTKLAEDLGWVFDEEKPTRVYDLVDFFFKKKRLREAEMAQYYAVPVMTDITEIISSAEIRNLWGNALSPSGESMIDVLSRSIITGANEYKLFYSRTQHTTRARVIVIDNAGMAGAARSQEGRRRFAVMMLYARQLGAREFFLHPDDIAEVTPPLYSQYHKERAKYILEQPKFLQYDEIHMAQGIPVVQEFIQKDAREGRKYNMVGMLSTQDLNDFSPELVKNSYNFLIMGSGNADDAQNIGRTFDLTESETNVIGKECTRPGVFFGYFKTRVGDISQILYTRPSNLEKWAYTTSAEDMAFRDELYDRIGLKSTLLFLSKHFPSGSVRKLQADLRHNSDSEAFDSSALTAATLKRVQPDLDEFLRNQNTESEWEQEIAEIKRRFEVGN